MSDEARTPDEIRRAILLAVPAGRIRVPKLPPEMEAAVAKVDGAREILGALMVLQAVGRGPEDLRDEAARIRDLESLPLPGVGPRPEKTVVALEHLARRVEGAIGIVETAGFRVDRVTLTVKIPGPDGRPSHLLNRLVVELYEALPLPEDGRVGNDRATRERISRLLAPAFPKHLLDPRRGGKIYEAIRDYLRR